MNIKENLGKNIKLYRKLNNITQEKLAELVDIEINSISYIERGKTFPSPDNLVKISKALNVSLSDLFNFQQEISCSDYLKEINNNLFLLKDDKVRLCAINSYIKLFLFAK